MDCCLSVANKTIDKPKVADYRRQISGQGCSIDAMIFVTRFDRKLCAPADELWVEELVKHVDSLKKYCKKHHYMGKRCFKVKRE
ncbi:C-C motif chemokine 21-like [Plectropomus leopardus]|uniref:C-C motif chemokine 21-like n=1 Tax=Plectropomus leopardus TaxID=160734 RepID=UPI001C4DD0DB|nr:C-C motif chemokine 21-like [Plectropomus leopardus]